MKGVVWYVYRIDHVTPRDHFDTGERWRYKCVVRDVRSRWITETLKVDHLEKYFEQLSIATWYKRPRLFTAVAQIEGVKTQIAGLSFDKQAPKIWFATGPLVFGVSIQIGAFWPWLQYTNITITDIEKDHPLMVSYRKVVKDA